MSDTAATPTPEPTATVRMLETVGPTLTDKQVYDFDSVWNVPLVRAQELEDAGLAEVISITDPPAPPAPDAPVVEAPDTDEE
ncbi:MAG: hypothetical protein KF709_02625 [Gemmatimonadaceae bacterium]|nr:hypothetical protein [Gemmatimonadaceae bacterium]